MAEVQLKAVRKVYGNGFVAVQGADFTVPDRSFTIFVGPSGCGKTTLLRMVAGLEEISSGDLLIEGRRVNNLPPKERDVAMVFQSYALYPHMTVAENMGFGLKLRGAPRAEIDKRVNEAAKILELESMLTRRPAALSGGQRQRVALGRAIVRKPRVFLFDEPLSNLDANLRVQMRNELARLHTRLQATMIYVTHDQVEAMTMGDQIVVLKEGVIQQIDAPLEIFRNPANRFVAGFIGSPAMNFLEVRGEARGDQFFLVGSDFAFRATPAMEASLRPSPGRSVILGVRPDHIHDRLFIPDADPERTASVTAEVVEPMGTETYVYFPLGGRTVTARFNTEEVPAVQQKVSLFFDLSKAFLFSAEDGLRIA